MQMRRSPAPAPVKVVASMRTKRSSSSTILMTPMTRGTWACGAFGLRKEIFGSQEKAPTRNGRLVFGCEGWVTRSLGTSSPAGFRTDLVAQPETAQTIRAAPNPKLFSFRRGLGEIAENLGALFLATPPRVLQTVPKDLATRWTVLDAVPKVQSLLVAAPRSASAGRSMSMGMRVTGG
jgi:hypothetical protein